LEMPNAPMVIALLANLLNAFLNWILIFGKFGIPAMGLFGAGIATTTTRWIMAASIIIFTIKYSRVSQFKPGIKLKPIDGSLIKKIIAVGLPSGFQYFLEVACFAFATIMVGWIGSKQQAANQIAMNLSSATYMVMLGISYAGTIRVGSAFGKKDTQEIRLSGFTAIGLSALLMLVFAVLFIAFRNSLPFIYNNNKDVVAYASSLLILAGIFELFDGLQASSIGALRGLTDVKVPLVISIFSYWIIAIPISWILGFQFGLGVVGVWIGLTVGLIIIGTSTLLRFHHKSRRIFE
jgi:multidrug resistance protein, MATE family